MAQVSEPALVAQSPARGFRLPQWGWQAATVGVVIVFLYWHILAFLAQDWWTDPNFSHGFFVPLFSGYLIWQHRHRLARLVPEPSWLGLAAIAFALGVLVLGSLGAELFLSRASFVLLLAGLIVFYAGWGVFRAVSFEWAVLFLAIPIPTIVMNGITLPLQFVASDLGSAFLSLVGVPVLRQGNIIQLATMNLEVAEACSGIRSLISLITLAVIYGYFLESRTSLRIALVLAAIPIAVFANATRIMATGLTGLYWSPDKAQGFFHEFSGWVIFLLALSMLFAVHGLLRWLARLGSRRRRA
jgi:exosortase